MRMAAIPLKDSETSAMVQFSLEAALGLRTSPDDSPTASTLQHQLEWNQWLAYFELSDAAAERKEELQAEMKDAVVGERYTRASQLKAELQDLEVRDSVATVQSQLMAALSEERYSDAAVLRDEGLTGLKGWWAGQAKDDPIGHVLQITQEYNRWTGRVFRPRDIAAMKVNKPTLLRMGKASPSPSLPPSLGSPILEIFLRPSNQLEQSPSSTDTLDLQTNQSSSSQSSQSLNSRFLQQAVSLRLPTMEEVETSKRHSSPFIHSKLQSPRSPDGHVLYEDPSRLKGERLENPYTAVRLSVCILNDGTATIKPIPPFFTSPSHNSPRSIVPSSAPDEQAVLRTLRWPSTKDAPPTPSPSGTPSISTTEDDQTDSIPLMKPDAHDNAGTMIVGSSGDDKEGRSLSHLPSSPSGLIYDEDEDGLITTDQDSFSELLRTPARIELLGRDLMAFHVPDSQRLSLSHNRQGSQDKLPSNLNSTMTSKQRLEAAMPPISAEDKPSTSSSEVASRFEVVIPMRLPLQGSHGGSLRGQAGSGAINNRMARAHLASSQDMDSSWGSSSPPDELLAVLAAQVAQSMKAKTGKSAPHKEIAQVMREVVRRVLAGESAASMEVRLAPSSEISSSDVDSLPEDVTTVLYKRIPADKVRTDPLSGLYLGSFGPHGPELLQLGRKMIDGEEFVEALKLTGDANVPAGSISFRAKVGKRHKLEARDVYPDELGIVARYRGEGRVAQRGYTEPRWVEGELLLFSAKGDHVTAGASLGFVWSVPGEKRLLILLNRVALD